MKQENDNGILISSVFATKLAVNVVFTKQKAM